MIDVISTSIVDGSNTTGFLLPPYPFDSVLRDSLVLDRDYIFRTQRTVLSVYPYVYPYVFLKF